MAHQLEVGVAHQVRHVVFGAAVEVVHAQNVVALGQQAIAQMGAQESGSSRHQDSFAVGYAHAGPRSFVKEMVGCRRRTVVQDRILRAAVCRTVGIMGEWTPVRGTSCNTQSPRN
ncbi:hypothetical protein FQZ97_1146970 [compost metagenome]